MYKSAVLMVLILLFSSTYAAAYCVNYDVSYIEDTGGMLGAAATAYTLAGCIGGTETKIEGLSESEIENIFSVFQEDSFLESSVDHRSDANFCLERPGGSFSCTVPEHSDDFQCCEMIDDSGENMNIFIFFREECPENFAERGDLLVNGKCSFRTDCSDDDDCTGRFHEYCLSDGKCGMNVCTTHDDCPSESVCTGVTIDGLEPGESFCSHVDTLDGDELGETVRHTGEYVLSAFEDIPPGTWDCDGTSEFCTTDCITNTDPVRVIAGFTLTPITNRFRDDTPDCKDWCVDKDGDESCDAESSNKVIDRRFYNWLTPEQQQVFDSVEYEIRDVEIFDPSYDYIQRDFFMGELIENPEIGKKMLDDCNDDVASITPLIEEDGLNSCNLIDNDCDNEVDECSDDPDSERPRECIYKRDYLTCEVLDADDDGYQNSDFGCPLCTDCQDDDENIFPGQNDATIDDDNNCNKVDGEMRDDNNDGITDEYRYEGSTENPDRCNEEGFNQPIDFNGCHYSTDNDNLVGWDD